MKLHRNAKATPASRLQLVRRAVYDGWRYQVVAESYGVSVRTVAKACVRSENSRRERHKVRAAADFPPGGVGRQARAR